MKEIPDCKGYYILFIENPVPIKKKIGSLGIQEIDKGTFIYIGSAMGRGGINGRVKRHLRKNKKIKWHIDYLTSMPQAKIIFIISICTNKKNLEEKLATELKDTLIPYIRKFGATDKKSPTHLYKCPTKPKKCLQQVIEKIITIKEIKTTKTEILELTKQKN